MSQYFYDGQIRRYLIQFAKLFSLWEVTKGKDPLGNPILMRVPIRYGDSSRQAAAAIAENSPSTLNSAPMFTYYISGLEYDQKRMQVPTFVDKVNVRQRAFNQDTQSYEHTQGQAFTIERLMPAPYTLRITVDLWTTNQQQKLEIIEQIGPVFNPGIELQSTDNFLDWTSLSVVFQDGLTYSSRTIPQGTGNAIEVLSWKFQMPIWISTPAKIKKLGVIEKIVASIYKGNALMDMQNDDLLLGTRQKITPYGYRVLLLGNTLQLLPSDSAGNDESLELPENPSTDIYWSGLLDVYGAVRPGISQIWLQNPNMATEIVGTIVPDPNDDRLLIFNIDTDTLPQNTIDPVDAVVNPMSAGPGAGLPAAVHGRRYLVVEDVGGSTLAWGNVQAAANDIIQYDAGLGQWTVSLDSSTQTTIHYVTNLTSGVQYCLINGAWLKSYEGVYAEGDYSIVI
jgi:hypothetical protein